MKRGDRSHPFCDEYESRLNQHTQPHRQTPHA